MHQTGQYNNRIYTECSEHLYCQWKNVDLQSNRPCKVGNRLSKPALEYKPKEDRNTVKNFCEFG